jgi:hypothetical protein
VQLELFEGEHLPLLRARAALERGDLQGAHASLAEAALRVSSPAVASRLGLLDRLLPGAAGTSGPSPERVHAVFEQALPGVVPSIQGSDWFRLYAAHMAAALEAEPERRFRGWCQLHYELAAGRIARALASAERLASAADRGALVGWPWLEAARAAFAAGQGQAARRWLLVACLGPGEPIGPAAPALQPAGRTELDPKDQALPPLPDAILDLWTEAFVLGLEEPRCAWVPSLGVLSGTFTLADLSCSEVARAAGSDLDHPPVDGDAARAFLRALVAAREARVREPGRCGTAELAARVAMKRASPVLLERYMQTVGLSG